MPPMFIQGLCATGKTSVVRSVLAALGCRVAYASCLELASVHLLYHRLLSQLSPERDALAAATYCDRFADFTVQLRPCCDPRRTTYIVRRGRRLARSLT